MNHLNLKKLAGVFVHSDIVVNGSNEDGDTYGEVYFCCVEDVDGKRHQHKARIDNIERAERLVIEIDEHLKSGGTLHPHHWFEIHASYGSVAYQRDGGEDDLISWELDRD